MDNIIYYNSLFDYYGELLTPTQINYFKAYYYDNLSLSEISDEYNVSRNAISKTLKEVKDKLDYYESKLHLHQNKETITNLLTEQEVNKKTSKELVNCAKMISKFDDKMISLKNI